MLGLILAGEAIYALPFHLTRFFRPTILEVFDLTATELGAAQSVYGIVAMLAYFPGGPLADRFPARKLMAMSLWTTAAGGLYLATFPDHTGTTLVFAFFGVTTILLFWAALIKAARDWGDEDTQGRAYGILDGGRGLLAAAMASIGVMVFGWAFPDGYEAATDAQRTEALRTVIYGYTSVTAFAGVFVWFALKDHGDSPTQLNDTRAALSNVPVVLRKPTVWLQACIVACAYAGFKGIDNYSLYAVQVYGLDPVRAGEIVAWGSWTRAIAALAAGFLGDRFSRPGMLLWLFVGLLISNLFFATYTPGEAAVVVLTSNVILASILVFALRGLYFSIFEDADVPTRATGTAVGVVSVTGYTPDIFMYLVAGILIDTYPGITGHQYYFYVLASFALLGAVASALFARVAREPPRKSSSEPARE